MMTSQQPLLYLPVWNRVGRASCLPAVCPLGNRCSLSVCCSLWRILYPVFRPGCTNRYHGIEAPGWQLDSLVGICLEGEGEDSIIDNRVKTEGTRILQFLWNLVFKVQDRGPTQFFSVLHRKKKSSKLFKIMCLFVFLARMDLMS